MNGDCEAAVDVLVQMSHTISSYDTTDAEEFINYDDQMKENLITIEDAAQCQAQIKKLEDLKDTLLINMIQIRTKALDLSRNIQHQCYFLKEILKQIHSKIETAFKCYTKPKGIISLALANNAIAKATNSSRNLGSLNNMGSTINYLKQCWAQMSPLKRALEINIKHFEDL